MAVTGGGRVLVSAAD